MDTGSFFVPFVVNLDGGADDLTTDSATTKPRGKSARRTLCGSDLFCFNPSMQQIWLAFVDDTYDDLEPRPLRLRLEGAGHAMSSAAKQIRTWTAFAKAIRHFSSPT